MEVFFSATFASYEAWIMVLCLLVFIGIYVFDGIAFVERVYRVLRPTQTQPIIPEIPSEPAPSIEITSPMLTDITHEEIQAHEEEKKEEQKAIDIIQQQADIIEESIREEIEEHPEIAQETIDEIVAEVTEEKKEVTPDIIGADKIDDHIAGGGTTSEEPSNLDDTATDVSSSQTQVQDTSDQDIKGPPSSTEGTTSAQPTHSIQEDTDTDAYKKNLTEIDTSNDTENATQTSNTDDTERDVIESTTTHVKTEKETNTEKLYILTNEVKTLIARGSSLEARSLIIQGLALNKNHRELNLILGSLYESDRQYQKAEYVYKDLALIYPEDVEILERLANILIVEKRYDIAMEIYKKITDIAGENEGNIYIMTHLAHELQNIEELYAYAKKYQKNWPNNPDILSLLAQAEIALGERQAAIQTLIKLKNLTPYNSEIQDMIAKLTMEEELAGNFGKQ